VFYLLRASFMEYTSFIVGFKVRLGNYLGGSSLIFVQSRILARCRIFSCIEKYESHMASRI
jgi:hypothetical protein